MVTKAQVIENLTRESDIPATSAIYSQLFEALQELPLPLVCLSVTRQSRSHYWSTEQSCSVPFLLLNLRHNEDVAAENVARGNWDAQWRCTPHVIEISNRIFSAHKLGPDFVSAKKLIFVHSFEARVFQELGRVCKTSVLQLVKKALPRRDQPRIFWDGRQLTSIFEDKENYKWAKKHQAQMLQEITCQFAAADVDRLCQSYPIHLKFGYGDELNLFHLIREDIG